MLYITFSHSVISFILGTLKVDYAINMAIITIIPSIPGIYGQRHLIAKYKK